MKALAGIVGFCSIVVSAAACDPGSAGDDGVEDQITCMAEVTLAGTFVESAPQPVDVLGCWPVGTWSFAPTIATNDCPTAPTLLPQYQFRVDKDLAAAEPDLTWIYTAVTPADPTAGLGVTSGGGGLCAGEFELYLGADGFTLVNLHPALQAGGLIDGQGTYEIHTTDQRPPPE